MKILAIDTTGAAASAAVLEDDLLLSEYTINYNMTHSQTIMPMIEAMSAMLKLDLQSLDYIAVSSGPGSFTGLRIGAATGKGIACGLQKPMVPVPTLDALAYNVFSSARLVCPIMDARRGQVYTALYQWEAQRLVRLTDYLAVALEDMVEICLEKKREVIFVGDGVAVHKELLSQYKEVFSFAPASCNRQRAASVACLAVALVEEGVYVEGSQFTPLYLRKPQAQRELEERIKGKAANK